MLRLLLLLFFLTISETNAKNKSGKAKPDIDVIDNDHDDFSFQSETNIFNKSTYSNSQLGFSSSTGIDIVASVQNIALSKNVEIITPNDVYLGVSYTYKATEDLSTVIGFQNGYQFYEGSYGKMQQFYFIDSEYKLFEHLHIHQGLYWASGAMTGIYDVVGFLSGIEVPFDDFNFEVDYFSGQNSISGAQATLSYFALDSLKLYIGAGVPETQSDNEFFGITGIQISTGSLQ